MQPHYKLLNNTFKRLEILLKRTTPFFYQVIPVICLQWLHLLFRFTIIFNQRVIKDFPILKLQLQLQLQLLSKAKTLLVRRSISFPFLLKIEKQNKQEMNCVSFFLLFPKDLFVFHFRLSQKRKEENVRCCNIN